MGPTEIQFCDDLLAGLNEPTGVGLSSELLDLQTNESQWLEQQRGNSGERLYRKAEKTTPGDEDRLG